MKLRAICLTTSALALLSPAVAFAQEAEEQRGDTIVVTAQFREQNLQDTPLAITAVNAEMLEARSQTNISQVANQAPSVTLKPNGAAFGPSLIGNIRGIGQIDFNPALEPGVGLYVDDVYYATLTGSVLDLLDLERVEILRGPQGTLAGRNSIGGAVKLYSQRPRGDNTGSITAAYGSRDRVDLRASFDANLAQGIDLRLAGVSKKQGGYVDRLDFGCVYPAGGGARLPANAPLNPGAEINPAVGGIPINLAPGAGCVFNREGDVDYMGLRGQLRFQPSDRLDINIIGDYTIDDRWQTGTVLLEGYYPNGVLASPIYPLPANPPYNTATPPTRDINPFGPGIAYDTRFICGRYCNFGTYTNLADGALPTDSANGRIKFEGWGLSGSIDLELSDTLALTSITAYRAYTSEFSNDNDASPMAHSVGSGPLTFRFFSQELRLNGAFGANNEVEWTLGGYYSDQRSVYTSFQGLRSSGLRFFQSDPVDADSKAVFAQIGYTPIDDLTINAGIRYTEESKTYNYVRLSPEGGLLGPPLGPLNGQSGTANAEKVDYRIAAQYRWSDTFMTYAQYATGFKGGGINPRPFFPQQVLPFGPETLESWEIGFKSDLFDRMLRFNVAAFLGNYDDIQLSLNNCTVQAGVGFGAPCALPTNAGDARIKGFEVETTLRPVDGLLIDGSLSFIDFDYRTFATFGTATVGGPGNLNGPQFGDYPGFTPRWKWAAGIQYEIDLGNSGSITPRFDLAYQGDMYANGTNRSTNLIPAYELANARLTWRNADGDLEISGEVTNLFNQYYFLTKFDQTIAGQGYVTGQPGRPREWALSMRKRF